MRLTTLIIIRYIVILISAAAVSFLVPSIPQKSVGLVPVAVLFTFLVTFLVNRTMDRKRALASSVAIELSRLRRIKHLAENVTDGIWKKKINDALTRCQAKLGENFLAYEEALGSFRDLTHLIYAYEPKDRREEILLADLLSTTRDLALERQRISTYLADHLLPTSWLTLGLVAFFFVIMLLMGRTDGLWSHLEIAMAIAAALLSLDFLYQRDRYSPQEVVRFQTLYQKNIAKTRE